jgi:hypothetical protein
MAERREVRQLLVQRRKAASASEAEGTSQGGSEV